MFTLLDYRACYRALLYIGYDRKLDECFSVSRSKKTYSDLLKIKERKTYSILFVEDDEHSIYLKGLFQDGHEDGILSRNVIIFSNSNTSKVLNLFKIRDRHLRTFAEENELSHR